MCWDAMRAFPSDSRAPSAARRFCTDHLTAAFADQPERSRLIEDVALIVSELTTNSVNAGAPTAVVSLTWHRHYLRLAIADDAPGLPTPHAASPDEPGGRGLAITEALSRAWGVEPTHRQGHHSGKQVWAEFSVAPILSADLNCRR